MHKLERESGYFICYQEDGVSLEGEVNRYLDAGWRLHGPTLQTQNGCWYQVVYRP